MYREMELIQKVIVKAWNVTFIFGFVQFQSSKDNILYLSSIRVRIP